MQFIISNSYSAVKSCVDNIRSDRFDVHKHDNVVYNA